MREKTVETWCTLEKAEHEIETVESLATLNPAALGRGNDRHNGKAGASRADKIIVRIRGQTRTVAREAAEGMRSLPKKTEGLALNEIEERLIWQAGR
jgi:hypothetical protein